MHNLHLVVVKAKTGADACRMVESELEGWGDENNWRSIGGAISAKGTIHLGEDARWTPADKGLNTLAKLNAIFNKMEIEPYYKEAFERVAAGKPQTLQDWYTASNYCDQMFHQSNKPAKFNVLTDEFKFGCYDELGVTRFVNDKDKGQIWVVFVDMHS